MCTFKWHRTNKARKIIKFKIKKLLKRKACHEQKAITTKILIVGNSYIQNPAAKNCPRLQENQWILKRCKLTKTNYFNITMWQVQPVSISCEFCLHSCKLHWCSKEWDIGAQLFIKWLFKMLLQIKPNLGWHITDTVVNFH